MRRAAQVSFTNSISLSERLNETGIRLLIILKARLAPEALVTGLAKASSPVCSAPRLGPHRRKAPNGQMTNDH